MMALRRPALVVAMLALVACGIDALGGAIALPDREGEDGGEAGALPDVLTGAEDAADAHVEEKADGACPSVRGPAMIHATVSGLSFCIDKTEVTEAQYASFLAAGAGLALLPAACAYKTGYNAAVPRGPMRPAGGVDWCDAFAFCAWAGKRLCTAPEWQNACSKGDASIFPYGNTFDASSCTYDAGAPTDVASAGGCEGGVPDLWDMSGNIDEWSAMCLSDAGAADTCFTHGGDYSGDPEIELRCSSVFARPRNAIVAFVGFRCCD